MSCDLRVDQDLNGRDVAGDARVLVRICWMSVYERNAEFEQSLHHASASPAMTPLRNLFVIGTVNTHLEIGPCRVSRSH